MSGNPSQCKYLVNASCVNSHDQALSFKPKWYFSKEEIEGHSPSRKDGIDHEHESHLRQLYCSYVQKLGIDLNMHQVTIATSMMLCHRFYMHQSHAKNHWQTVANASLFLACKVDDTPCWLKDLVVAAYKLMYSWDPLAPQKIRQKEIYDKQKELILLAEQLVLVTVAFDLNIELPYKPLVAALKRLGISQKEVMRVAWNFANDWLRTTLCLEYKPHYIAAGSVFLAAKHQKLKLPSSNGIVWWMQFDVLPKQLEEVIQRMLQLLGQSPKQSDPFSSASKSKQKPATPVKRKHGISESSISSASLFGKDSSSYSVETAPELSKFPDIKKLPNSENNQRSDSGTADSTVEDGDAEVLTRDSNRESSCKIVSVKENLYPEIDLARIKERLKRRKLDRTENKKLARCSHFEDGISDEAWIERELENGIETVSVVSNTIL